MKSISNFLIPALLLALAAIMPAGAHAKSLRQTSNPEGLSSSAVQTLAQDSEGFLWIGTLDGINISDGSKIVPFNAIYPGVALSGNIIEKILSGGDIMWINTNHGLNRFDVRSMSLTTFPFFNGQELLAVSPAGDLFAYTTEGKLIYLPMASADKFVDVSVERPIAGVPVAISSQGDSLTVLGSDGVARHAFRADGSPTLGPGRKLSDVPVQVAHTQGDIIYAAGTDNVLRRIGPSGTVTEMLDFSKAARGRGALSDIVCDSRGDVYLSFMTSGVVRAQRSQTAEWRFTDIDLGSGVFCLLESDTQPVVWIGSDCQGLFTYYDSPYVINTFDFNYFNGKLSHPIRALCLDRASNLWLGTKGDGLVRISDFRPDRPERASIDLFNTANSALSHNSVFALTESSRPLMWIATENGINYYSYGDTRIHAAGGIGPDLKYVYSLHEENDSTLWAAIPGGGIVRCRITGPDSSPQLAIVKRYTVDGGRQTSNYFFDISADSQGKLLFANRGLGAFVIDGDSICGAVVPAQSSAQSVNDVFSVVYDDSVKWLGTGSGLLMATPTRQKLFSGPENGFLSNTVHDMLRDKDGKLWISTNNGLVCFDIRTEKARNMGRQHGVGVGEFSDGAAFYSGSILLFGGIDGFVTVAPSPGYVEPAPYRPSLSLRSLTVAGENVDVKDYISHKGGHTELRLNPGQTYFSVSFAVPDFLNPSDYAYLYSLDGREWIDNGADGTIAFNEMGYGKYILRVKYINRITGIESTPLELLINARAPWYLSTAAKTVYLLIFLALAGGAAAYYLRRQRRHRREEMVLLEHQHREELYEEKLRFFTNITHEFCTPLTLIYGPCERIADYQGSDSYIRKYIRLIRANVERLNTLIQELIDFRRIETGHKVLKIRPVNISNLCNDTIDTFTDLAERNNITFSGDIAEDVTWNTDFSSLRKIINNLISNAFKYTPESGEINVSMKPEDGRLVIRVYNTGKGIPEKDYARIFDRYSVLDNVEENAVKGITARNGLGLAICHSMVKMLEGEITIDSRVGEYACFVVSLPMLQPNAEGEPSAKTDEAVPAAPGKATEETVQSAPSEKGEDRRPTVLVIDDNTEILSLLADSLTDYRVLTAKSAEEGLELLKKGAPNIIITDVMMPGTDGLTFARQIKKNRHTMHLPLIILSAKNSVEETVEGISMGADVYIGKPFSLSYLRAVINRLLESRNTLREYYNSSASAYEYTDGRLMERDDKDFLERVTRFIDQNIDDPDLSPEQLATALQMSLRNLYRKFKELDQPTPNDFIKNHRISYAAKLLLTTSLTVQEIIYRTGFSNRSHFYKAFDKRYGTTPKDYRKAGKSPDASFDDSTTEN